MNALAVRRPALSFLRGGGGGFSLPVRRSTGPSPSLVKARSAIDGMRVQLRKARENAGGKGGKVATVVLTLVGGAVSGAIKAKFPALFGYDTRVFASAGLIGAGIFLVRGNLGTYLVDVGAGLVACIASDMVEDALDGENTVQVQVAA